MAKLFFTPESGAYMFDFPLPFSENKCMADLIILIIFALFSARIHIHMDIEQALQETLDKRKDQSTGICRLTCYFEADAQLQVAMARKHTERIALKLLFCPIE